jgi:hypothetical protein
MMMTDSGRATVTPFLGGSVRHGGRSGTNGHPADGMTAHVDHGGGAVSTIIDPRSFDNGGPEWVMRYGDPESIRYTVASLLSSYDYLLSGEITQREAIKRLALMRRARAAIAQKGSDNA